MVAKCIEELTHNSSCLSVGLNRALEFLILSGIVGRFDCIIMDRWSFLCGGILSQIFIIALL